MASKSPELRVVALGERPVSPKPATIAAATEHTERTLLVALRDKLAAELDRGVPAHALKGVVAEIRDVDRSIRALDQAAAEDGSVVANTDDEAFDGTGY